MSKESEYRLWLLKRHWGRHGWTMIPNATKRDIAARDKLIRDGLLEKDDHCDMCRITDAGLKFLGVIP